MTPIGEEKIVSVNDVFGELIDLEEQEKQSLYDVIQALVSAHNLYIDNLNERKKRTEDQLIKEGVEENNLFGYWFFVMLFMTTAWRVGFEQTSQMGYGSLLGVLNQYINGEDDNWYAFCRSASQQREMVETITDLLFGLKGADEV